MRRVLLFALLVFVLTPALPAQAAANSALKSCQMGDRPVTVTLKSDAVSGGASRTWLSARGGVARSGDVLTVEHRVGGTWQPLTYSQARSSTTLSLRVLPQESGLYRTTLTHGGTTCSTAAVTVR